MIQRLCEIVIVWGFTVWGLFLMVFQLQIHCGSVISAVESMFKNSSKYALCVHGTVIW